MNVLIAIDSMKGSLTSMEAGYAIKQGIQKASQDTLVTVCPLADGGEGTVNALIEGMGGEYHKIMVTGPLGDRINSEYGIIKETNTAVIEMAAAAGITLLNEENRNPLITTTYGVGEMILDAIRKGCRNFLIGIGGSATNDCGVGMLQALGYEFLDCKGEQVGYGAFGVSKIVSIHDEHVAKELKDCRFQIACDVTNPLCGEFGCSKVYGPQKGATDEMISDMDQWLKNFANLVKQKYGDADELYPGTGAAGGLGYAFLTFTNAILESGIQLVIKETRLEELIKKADIIVTGEGRLDGQTAMGKAPIGVAQLAKRYHKLVIAFAGCVTEDAINCNENGIDAFFPILRTVTSLPDAMKKENARNNMISTVEQVFRLIQSCKK